MKKQRTKLEGLLQLTILFCVVGFCSIAHAAIVVDMEVSPAEDKLLVKTHGTCISGQNPKGCIHVTGKQQINFNLKNKKCSEANGARWELESVVLSTSKGVQTGISAVAASDFGANEASGIVTATVSQNAHHIGIRDNNTAEYEVWYTVFAKCVGGNSKIDIDPRIKNDGTGYN